MSDQVPLAAQSQIPTMSDNASHFGAVSNTQQEVPSQSQSDPNDQLSDDMGVDMPTLTEVEEMEKEAAKLRQIHSQLGAVPNEEEAAAKAEVDSRSIYVGNVDYETTPMELQLHFSESGQVERVTIMTNKLTGQPKGFAYLEFSLPDGANKAVATQDGSLFRDRELKVSLKRTNIPNFGGRGRGGRGRGRGAFRGRGRPGPRGRGGFRGGARFSPY